MGSSYSRDWWIGVGLAWIAQVLVFLVADKLPNSSPLLQWLSVFGLLAWVGMPFMVFLDIQYLRSISAWEPRRWLYILLSAIPAINLVFGVMYLYHRHEVGLAHDHGFESDHGPVSDNWWEYILISILYLMTTMAVPFRYLEPHLTEPITIPGAVLTLAFLGATFGMGVAIAYDRLYVSAVSDWTPSRLYVLFGSLPGINITIGLYYLGIRHLTLGRHPSETNDTETDEEKGEQE